MIKIVSKLFGGVFGGNIKIVGIGAVVVALLFVGWHYPNTITKAKERKETISELQEEIGKHQDKISMLEGKIAQDSTMYLANVETFQKNILELQNRNKKTLKEVELAKAELKDCENGLDCWEKKPLGKWKKVKCAER